MDTKQSKPKNKLSLSIKKPKMYKVIFLNDDFTPFIFVEQLLLVIFNKTDAEAKTIALKVHEDGKAIVSVYPQEIAQTKQAQTIFNAKENKFPLMCELEPVDDE